MKDWPSWETGGGLARISDGSPNFENYWREIFQRVSDGKLDTWDYQWVFRCWLNSNVSILPTNSLVENIGFGKDATHTTGKTPEYLKRSKIQAVTFPLLHPVDVQLTPFIDRIIAKTVFSAKLRTRLVNLVQSIPLFGAVLIRLKRRYL